MTKEQALKVIENTQLTTAQWTALEWYLKNKGEGDN
jgi:hypothetical protein